VIMIRFTNDSRVLFRTKADGIYPLFNANTVMCCKVPGNPRMRYFLLLGVPYLVVALGMDSAT